MAHYLSAQPQLEILVQSRLKSGYILLRATIYEQGFCTSILHPSLTCTHLCLLLETQVAMCTACAATWVGATLHALREDIFGECICLDPSSNAICWLNKPCWIGSRAADPDVQASPADYLAAKK